MSLFEQVQDPTDLSRIRSVIAASENPGALVPLGISVLEISDEAALHTTQRLTELLAAAGKKDVGSKVVVIVDATPIFKGQIDLKAAVVAQLSERFEVVTLVLGDEHHLYADDEALDAAAAAVEDADGVVSVGSGTISDIAKVATNRAGNLPYVMVQTAASVDGYTDNVSVILRSGAKRTIDSRWPDVVLADTETIATAPLELNTSGFGELLSLFTAPADWWLASRIGTDATFHSTPRDLLLTFAGNPAEWGAGISEGRREAVEQLTKVLAIRGIGTGIAGTTACLSGMEHLISHMLDMYAAAHGHEIGLHGSQVGVASVVGATAWQYLLEQIRAGRAMADLDGQTDPAIEGRLLAVFVECDPSGSLGAECYRDFAKKQVSWQGTAENVKALVSDADDLTNALATMLPNPEHLAHGLKVAGATAHFTQLAPWVTPEVWRWAVSNCFFMRNRVTVVDLLDRLGWWTETDIDEVLARVDALTGVTANV